MIVAATPLKLCTMLLTTYAAGLRLNEVLHLRVTDIDSGRLTIRVEQGRSLPLALAQVVEQAGARTAGYFHSTDNCLDGLSPIDCSRSTSIELRTGSNES